MLLVWVKRSKKVKHQKTLLSATDEAQIIKSFNNKEAVDDFSVVVSYEDIQAKNYSLSAGQYLKNQITYNDISEAEYNARLSEYSRN